MDGKLPVGRIGKPDEVAQFIEAVLGNSLITGLVIEVDGGGSLYLLKIKEKE